MRTKYYNSSNNFSAPVKKEPRPYSPYPLKSEVIVPEKPPGILQEPTPAPIPCENEIKDVSLSKKSEELSLKSDDLLLLGLILLLLPKAKDNLLLILALGYLLIF